MTKKKRRKRRNFVKKKDEEGRPLKRRKKVGKKDLCDSVVTRILRVVGLSPNVFSKSYF